MRTVSAARIARTPLGRPWMVCAVAILLLAGCKTTYKTQTNPANTMSFEYPSSFAVDYQNTNKNSVHIERYSCAGSGNVEEVSVLHFIDWVDPNASPDSTTAAKEYLATLIKGMGGTINTSEKSDYNGTPGWRVRCSLPANGNTATCEMRGYQKGKDFYLLIVSGSSKTSPDSEEAQRFFQTVKLP